MLFNSFEFIVIFLPITFYLYFYLKKNFKRTSIIFLILISLFFYSYWNVIYLPLILVSIFINHLFGIFLSSKNNSKYFFSKLSILTLGIILNLSLLGYFKYSDFFIKNFNLLFNTNFKYLYLSLPLAISFFTFQQIIYLIDSYKQNNKNHKLLHYILFITFFPQLIAGPIVRFNNLVPQFFYSKNGIKNYKNISMGIFLLSIGLFKKIVIADNLSILVSNGFDTAANLNFFEAHLVSFSYTFQIYFDFSGYMDMAMGAALLFNIKLPINFNSPYKATNIQDFWRRWHITLSSFLKHYVYIPLGGNKKNEYIAYINILVTFVIGGFWHGANWTFVIWGGIHGLALIIYKVWTKFGFRLWNFLSWFLTFYFINISWIFFRANELSDVTRILTSLFNVGGLDLGIFSIFSNFFEYLNSSNQNKFSLILIVSSFLLIFTKNSLEFVNSLTDKKKYFIETIFFALIFTISFILMTFGINQEKEFIYFVF